MFKMGSHHPFGHLKHKLWPKEKYGIDPISLHLSGVRHTVGKFLMRNIILLQTSFPSEVYTQSYGAPKLQESQLWQFWDSHLGVPGQKAHLDVGPVERRRIYYKGEGGDFPQVWAVVSLVSPSCPWLILAPKVLQLCTNHFVLVLCRSMWVNKACQIFLIPSRSSSMPFYPSKVLRTRERASIPWLSAVFCLGLTFESFKESGVRHIGLVIKWHFSVMIYDREIKIMVKNFCLI